MAESRKDDVNEMNVECLIQNISRGSVTLDDEDHHATNEKSRDKNNMAAPIEVTNNVESWQEVKKITTNLYIGDHVFNLESLVFGYKIYDQAYFDLNLLITLIFFSIYKAYYISNQKQKKVDIFKIFKDEVNNVFDTNIFR